MGCVRYTDRSPPCNHACFTNPANWKRNSLKSKCYRHFCTKDNISASGTWDMADHDRKFICIVGLQNPWIWTQFNSGKYQTSLQTYHPLDKTKKLSRKKAKFKTLAKYTMRQLLPPGVTRQHQSLMAFKAGGKKPLIRLMYTGHSDTFNYLVPIGVSNAKGKNR